MPRAAFNFGSRPHTMEVEYRWWGREAYFVDGNLLHQRTNLSLAGEREFKVGNHAVRIEVCVGPKEYFTRVYVDGRLHVDELFPQVKARVDKWKKPPYCYLVPGAFFIACFFLGLWLTG